MGAHQPVDEGELLTLLERAAKDLDVKAWIVGGYVRDKLLGRPHANPDVVVENGDALALARHFAELAGAPPPVTSTLRHRSGHAAGSPRRARHRQVRVLRSRLAQARRPPGKPRGRPRRRDFTINTLLMDTKARSGIRSAGGRTSPRSCSAPIRPERTFEDDPCACCGRSASRPSSASNGAEPRAACASSAGSRRL